MKLALCHSMHFAEKAKAVRDELLKLGHDARLPLSNESFLGLNDADKETLKLKQKYEHDAMGLAYALHKPIFLLEPIPKMPHYETEIIAMKPIVLNSQLEKLI